MENKKIIIWTKGLDDFLEGYKKFNGGIAVQLTFWAKIFHDNNWEVYSLSSRQNNNIEGVNFIKVPEIKVLGFIMYFCYSFKTILKLKPNVIIFRGAGRNLFPVAFCAKLFRVKLVFMGANDINFLPGKERIKGSIINSYLFRVGIKLTNCFVVQNKFQKEQLNLNYNKVSIIIPNIWRNDKFLVKENLPLNSILWVGNFRHQKRPEWFIGLAKSLPDQNFLMIGFPNDIELFKKVKELANNVENLKIIDGLPFKKTASFFTKAKLFICTSRHEGFPNTFLQAWSNAVPVISSVDPSDIIQKNNLGALVHTEEQLLRSTKRLLANDKLFMEYQKNINQYFSGNHDCQKQFETLIKHIEF
jgi:glycosyltransferase involved in cell wall biosynthesis